MLKVIAAVFAAIAAGKVLKFLLGLLAAAFVVIGSIVALVLLAHYM